jgi:hypothetical protein
MLRLIHNADRMPEPTGTVATLLRIRLVRVRHEPSPARIHWRAMLRPDDLSGEIMRGAPGTLPAH